MLVSNRMFVSLSHISHGMETAQVRVDSPVDQLGFVHVVGD